MRRSAPAGPGRRAFPSAAPPPVQPWHPLPSCRPAAQDRLPGKLVEAKATRQPPWALCAENADTAPAPEWSTLRWPVRQCDAHQFGPGVLLRHLVKLRNHQRLLGVAVGGNLQEQAGGGGGGGEPGEPASHIETGAGLRDGDHC